MFRCAFLLVILSVMSIGCHKSNAPLSEKKQFLRIHLHVEPPSLNISQATDVASISVLSLCFEGLLRKDSEGKISPGVAERYEISDDQKTYTFFIRSGLTWSDGTPLTAYDFEAYWKQILSPKFPCPFADDLYILKNATAVKMGSVSVEELGVKTLSPLQLQVTLERIAPYFLDICSSFPFYPNARAAREHTDSHLSHQNIVVSNGPYEITQWKHHNKIVLKKNPFYWNREKIVLEEIQFHIVEDESTALNLFHAGDLEWTGYPLSTLPPDSLEILKKNDLLCSQHVSGVYAYLFNLDKPPFNNLNMRKAFSLAISRQDIIDHILLAEPVAALGLVPPTVWKTHPHFEDGDLKKAREYFALGLAELNITKETFPPVVLMFNTLGIHSKIAQVVQEQWHEAFGIQVTLAHKEWKVFLEEVHHGQFDIAKMSWIANYKDPTSFLDLYRHRDNPRNCQKWSHPLFTELLVEAENCMDLEKREELLRKAETIFMEQMPIAPIYYQVGNYVKQEYLRGVFVSDLSDIDFSRSFVEMP